MSDGKMNTSARGRGLLDRLRWHRVAMRSWPHRWPLVIHHSAGRLGRQR